MSVQQLFRVLYKSSCMYKDKQVDAPDQLLRLHQFASGQYIINMTPFIPQELSDVIIDYLHDDRPALGRCGLVCWSWLPSSCFHLFSTIKLFHYDMNAALTILCAHNSTIIPYVKNLSVFHVEWHSLTLEAKDRLLALSHSLKTLNLSSMEFQTVDQAFEFISSAPLLECLLVDDIYVRKNENAALTKFTPPPMKRIMFRTESYTIVFRIIEWLFLWQPVPTVRRLAFHWIHRTEIPSISASLRALGPVLEHLELSFEKYPNISLYEYEGMQVDLIAPTSGNI
jgi:hypothetical protein